jgi:acetylglutamate kinase
VTSVYKIGGKILDDEAALKRFCRWFAALPGPKALVHGGNVLASRVQEALGVPAVRIEGRRATDADTLQVVTMVYAGWYNKHVTALLQAEGCDAIGLSGCDAGVITAGRRPPLTLADGSSVDFGFVGDVTPASVRVPFVQGLLDQGLVPVFCAINHDGAGQLLNTNADTVAASLASALCARLVYCFEMDGVLSDPSDPSSVIPEIDSAALERLKADGTVSGGMLPKLDTAFAALRAGVPEVYIGKTHICL